MEILITLVRCFLIFMLRIGQRSLGSISSYFFLKAISIPTGMRMRPRIRKAGRTM
jgi:hypothetical protein